MRPFRPELPGAAMMSGIHYLGRRFQIEPATCRGVRLPDWLWSQLEVAAERRGIFTNREVFERLVDSFPQEPVKGVDRKISEERRN